MKKILTLLAILFACNLAVFSQDWQQTSGVPEGAGINDLYYHEMTGYLYAATGSFTWPNGDAGGIRRSADEGETWENLFDCYTARKIVGGSSGQLYASMWNYPEPEGLYKSSDFGVTWDLLTNAPNNGSFNTIAVDDYSNGNVVIYTGTGTGVYRSMDNGLSWDFANTGLFDTHVNIISADSNGIVVAATNDGLYVSIDHGDNWEKSTGITVGSYITALNFDYPPDAAGQVNLLVGTNQGEIYTASDDLFYAACAVAYVFLDENTQMEVLGSMVFNSQHKLYYYGTSNIGPPNESTGAFKAENDPSDVQPWNGGMNNMSNELLKKISAKRGEYSKDYNDATFFAGFFGGTNGGAKIYKTTYFLSTNEFDLQEPETVNVQPNPSSDRFVIRFVAAQVPVSLSIYNLSGEKIWTMENHLAKTGNNEIVWDSRDADAGMYFYTLSDKSKNRSGKLIVR